MSDQFFAVNGLAMTGIVANIVTVILSLSLICVFFLMWRISRVIEALFHLTAYYLVGTSTWALLMLGWVYVARPFFGSAQVIGSQGLLLLVLMWIVAISFQAAPLLFASRNSEANGPLDHLVRALAMGFGQATPWLLGPLFSWSIVSNARVVIPLLGLLVLPSAFMGFGVAFAKHRAGEVRQSIFCSLAVLLASLLGAGLVQLAILADVETFASQYRLSKLILALGPLGPLGAAMVFVGAWALEKKIIATELAEEVTLGVLPDWVSEVIPIARRRLRSDWWFRRDERREIVLLLGTLAFRKHRLRGLPAEQARIYGLEVGRLRQRARAILNSSVISCAPPSEEIIFS